MPAKPSIRLQRRFLTLALLSALAAPAYAGANCQLVDNTGAPLPVDSSAAPATDALACGPGAEANGVLNIGGYVPCGLMPMLTGALVDRTSLAFGTVCFALFVTVVAIGVWRFVLRALRLILPLSTPITPGSVL